MVNQKASSFISQKEKYDCLEHLKQAESKTSGEIVPVIASASGRYDRAEDIVGLLVAVAVFVLTWLFYQGVGSSEDWGSDHQVALGILPCVVVIILGFIVGSALAARLPILRLPFILKREKTEEVEKRAAECFYRYGIGRTKGATGVLIYVSLYERMVVVKGDLAISKKIDQSQWQSVCQAVLDGIKDGLPGAGLSRGIEKCGELLAQHFPAQDSDVNELPDEIHCID